MEIGFTDCYYVLSKLRLGGRIQPGNNEKEESHVL